MLARARALVLYATDAIAARFPAPALVHARALLPTVGVGTRLRDTQAHTDQGEDLSIAAVLLHEISTAPLAHGLGLQSGGATVCRPGVGLRATSVEGMAADVAVAPGAIQSVQAAHVHFPLPVLVLAHARVLYLTHLTRGIVEAGRGLSVVVEGVTVGTTSEIAGPDHRHNVSTKV